MLETKLLTRKSKEYKLVWQLYKQTFPIQERIPKFFLNCLRLRKGAQFVVFSDNHEFCGFTFLMHYREITFIVFFAVNTDMRSHGYGTQMMEWIKQQNPRHTLVLNIEDVDTRFNDFEQRNRRYSFYIKNGFKDSGFYEGSKKVPYDVLYNGKKFPHLDYLKAVAKLSFGIIRIKLHPKKEIHPEQQNETN